MPAPDSPTAISPAEPLPFLLNSWSQDFLAGKPDDLLRRLGTGEGAVGRAALGRVGFAAFLVLVLARDGAPAGAYAAVLLILPPTAFFTARAVRRIKTRRRLARAGELLEGEIVRCTGRTARSGGEDGSYYHRETVEYRLGTPSGRELRGKDWAEREDLGAPLPGLGTPVLVLFLEEGTHRLLQRLCQRRKCGPHAARRTQPPHFRLWRDLRRCRPSSRTASLRRPRPTG
jgi:hypothetical protein